MSFASSSVSYLQGSATAALTWVVYDLCLSLNRERSTWSLSNSSSFSVVITRFSPWVGTKHFILPLPTTNHHDLPANSGFFALSQPETIGSRVSQTSNSLISRWYLGLTEVFSILAGELMILIRINAVYGWSRKIVLLTLFLFGAESVIGLVTTILSIRGGSTHLLGSTGILACTPNEVTIPDINISKRCTSMAVACIYLGLIIQKATDVVQVIEAADGHGKLSLFAAFKSTRMTPTLHLCLRDAALYFFVIFGALLLNLVLTLQHNRYAQLGTPWLLATYSVASTRIFLNLKNMSLAHDLNTGPTWSEFQQSSALEFQMQSAQREMRELRASWRGSHEVTSPLAVWQPQARRREDWEDSHSDPDTYVSRSSNVQGRSTA
ncbi:hypothetical protein B0H17DRAFT_1185649 [Mycena rosella]|uniref:Transmembrane protein n=1 Tax=Mycena rosella TaxID=1033263 RepID=A0AAD7CQJ6_MYCRO|nr:hypothetical protein B0H17DRAFT_1185649 [Mycena rosella]